MNPIIAPTAEVRERLRRQIRAEWRPRHEAERAEAGFWRAMILRLKQEREVARELKRRLPPGAFYGR